MKNIRKIALILALNTILSHSLMASGIPAANTEVIKEEIAEAEIKKGKTEEELAKQLANPIANLISLPMQFNYDRGFANTTGNDSNRWTLNVQPVIPISINDDWIAVSRTIVPLMRTDNLPLGSGITYGVGDVVQSIFFSPMAPTDSGWIWGAGPVFMIPSGSDLSTDTWGAGPTAIALKQDGPWTYGGLANHIWSVDGDIDISSTYVQPFVVYTTPTALSVVLQTEILYNWEATDDNEWTVPLFLIVTQVDKIGSQTISYGGGVKYYAESPEGGPEGWGLRFVFTMLFPK